jgi:hypothetical protein
MDLVGSKGDPVNKRLMSCIGIFVSVDQCLQLVHPPSVPYRWMTSRRISRPRMRCACFSLANSGACLPSSLSQTHRIHSEGVITFGPESTAQRKPSRVDTSIAFSRPPSESRNASSFSISRLVSGPDLINLIRRGRDASREAIAERIMIMAATVSRNAKISSVSQNFRVLSKDRVIVAGEAEMRMRAVMLAVGLVAALMANCGVAVAEQDVTSANFLMSACRDVVSGNMSNGESKGDLFAMGLCAGIISGLSYMGTFYGLCSPIGVTPQQAVSVVVQYIDHQPARMDEDFRVLASEALRAAWPCKN